VGAGMVSVLVFPLLGFALAGPGAGTVHPELFDGSDAARDFL
jgi:hypothetical protein